MTPLSLYTGSPSFLRSSPHPPSGQQSWPLDAPNTAKINTETEVFKQRRKHLKASLRLNVTKVHDWLSPTLLKSVAILCNNCVVPMSPQDCITNNAAQVNNSVHANALQGGDSRHAPWLGWLQFGDLPLPVGCYRYEFLGRLCHPVQHLSWHHVAWRMDSASGCRVRVILLNFNDHIQLSAFVCDIERVLPSTEPAKMACIWFGEVCLS